MCQDTNPYEGAIARNFSDMKRITEASRKYEKTGDDMQWRNIRTGEIIVTNL